MMRRSHYGTAKAANALRRGGVVGAATALLYACAVQAGPPPACLQTVTLTPGEHAHIVLADARVLIEEVGTDVEYRWNDASEFVSVTTPPDRLGFDVLTAQSKLLTLRTRTGQGGGLVRLSSCLDESEIAFFSGLAKLQRHSLENGRDAAKAAMPSLEYLRRWPLATTHLGWVSSAYANVLASAGENNAAEKTFLDSSRHWQSAGRADRAAIALMAAGDNASRANRFDDARAWLTQARDELERLGITYYALRSDSSLCTVLAREANVEAALVCETQVIPRWTATGELRETAVRQISAGNLSLRAGRLTTARQLFLDAERSIAVLPPILQSRLSTGLGNYELAIGNIPAAATHYARAIHRLGNAGLPDDQTNLDIRLALLAGVVSALPDQIRLLESALTRLSDANDPIRMAEVNLLIAKPLLKLGDSRKALASARTASKLCTATKNQRCIELAALFEIEALANSDPVAAKEKLAELPAASESTTAGWRTYLNAKVQHALARPLESQRILDTLSAQQNELELQIDTSLLRAENFQALDQRDNAIAELGTALRDHSDAISNWASPALVISARAHLVELQAAFFDLVATAASTPAQQIRFDAIVAAVQATDPRRLLHRRSATTLAEPLRRALSASIAESRLDGQRGVFAAMSVETRKAPTQPSTTRWPAPAISQQDTLLLLPLIGNESFTLLAISDGRVHTCLTWPTARYLDLVARFNAILDGAEGNLAVVNEAAAQWHRIVLDCENGTAAIKWHVVKLPGTPLLPWAWIAVAGSARNEEPTVTIGFNLPTTWDSALAKPETVLLLDLDMPAVAPLPQASAEVDGVASLLAARGVQAKSLRAMDLDVDGIKRELAAAEVIHIVGHANPAAFGNLYQGLWFESGGAGTLITYPEIASQTLQAELVVLSACGTRSDQTGSQTSWSLAEAFIAAGAQRVVAAANPLSDSAGPLWTKTFHDALWRTGEPALAVRRARQILRESPHFKHPKFWAGIDYFISASAKPQVQAEKSLPDSPDNKE